MAYSRYSILYDVARKNVQVTLATPTAKSRVCVIGFMTDRDHCRILVVCEVVLCGGCG